MLLSRLIPTIYASNCYAALSIGVDPERWTTGTPPEEREHVRAAARRQPPRHWEICADTFAATPYLCGARPGALDSLAAQRPAFAATLARIDSDPLVAAVFAAHWDA